MGIIQTVPFVRSHSTLPLLFLLHNTFLEVEEKMFIRKNMIERPTCYSRDDDYVRNEDKKTAIFFVQRRMTMTTAYKRFKT